MFSLCYRRVSQPLNWLHFRLTGAAISASQHRMGPGTLDRSTDAVGGWGSICCDLQQAAQSGLEGLYILQVLQLHVEDSKPAGVISSVTDIFECADSSSCYLNCR